MGSRTVLFDGADLGQISATGTSSNSGLNQQYHEALDGVSSHDYLINQIINYSGAASQLPTTIASAFTYTVSPNEISFGIFSRGGKSLLLKPTSLTYSLVAPTPLPAALPLFASGLAGLGLLGWSRKKRAPAKSSA